jgi:hypothetical protein
MLRTDRQGGGRLETRMELQFMHAIEFIYSHQATPLAKHHARLSVCLSVYVQTTTKDITFRNRCCHAAAHIHRRHTRLGAPDRRIRLVDIRPEAVRSHQVRLDRRGCLDRIRRVGMVDHRRSLVAGRQVAAVRSCHLAGCMTRIEGRSSAMGRHVVSHSLAAVGRRAANRSFVAMVRHAASHSPVAMDPDESHQNESHSSGMADQMAGRKSGVQNQSMYRWNRRLTSSRSHRHCSACHGHP